MMKLFAILRKDLTQSFRSYFALAFMFVVPMLTTLLFYFIFGGNDEQFELPVTHVVVVNLDQGQVFAGDGEILLNELAAGSDLDLNGVVSMGDLLTRLLKSDSFSDTIVVEELPDLPNAHARVDNQEAGLAIIIPENFSDALTAQQATASVELYKDPTLTLGPSIVETIVTSILDGFMANKITIGVALEQFAQAGGKVDQDVIQDIIELSNESINQASSGSGASAQSASIEVVEVSSGKQSGILAGILGTVLAGMAVFYMFFTAAATMQSILVEDEKGTLPRLFTTPTPRSTILNGKTLAVFVVLIVQISVLIVFGRFVFNIYWGEPLPLVITTVCVIVLAGSAGLFILSWLQNTRQAGFVFGGVLTITGMLGMVTLFTGGPGTASPAVEQASLLVPQGWAVRAFQLSMGGGDLVDLLPTLGGILAWALVLGAIGQFRLRRRYT